MADNVRKYGFRFIKSIQGQPNPKPIRCPIASAYQPAVGATSVNLNVGDPVLRTTTGTIIKAIGTEGTQSQIYGIIVGFGPMYQAGAMLPSDKYPAPITYGTARDRESAAYVVPVVGNLFEVDCNAILSGATTYFDYRALIGENADMILTADTSDASNPKMTPQLNVSTHAGTSTLQWRIEGVSTCAENADFSGNYVKLIVTPNVVQQAPYQTTGI